MNYASKRLLYLQYTTGRIAVWFVAPLLYVVLKCMGYRFRNLAATRQRVRELLDSHRGPWILCPNHLTMIDSALVSYALMPMHRYLFDYHLVPWNLPERANFQRNIVLSVFCYLTKCIPISRGGDRTRIKHTLEKCTYLLEQKEQLLIFPEGGRSRTSRVDTENFSYGVGRLVRTVPNCHVLCIYLRGDRQDTYSNIPRFGERFTVSVDALAPCTTSSGLKAQRECARQITEHLAHMEEEYYAVRRKRHS